MEGNKLVLLTGTGFTISGAATEVAKCYVAILATLKANVEMWETKKEREDALKELLKDVRIDIDGEDK